MIKVHIVTAQGSDLYAEANSDQSVMEVLRDNGMEEIQALCSGQLSCATCHVYVDPAYADRLPPMSAEEDDLLDSSDHRTAYSRLSCQIPCINPLDGIKVTVAPAD
jgi:2Fe-2S ferredoxin